MLKKTKAFLGVVLILSWAFVSSGCVWLAVGAAAGAGTYAWISGVLQKDFMVSAEELQNATRQGLRDLNVVIREQTEDRLSAIYRAKFADGENVTIDIVALTERSARIRIRIGVFGDQAKSEMILNAIEQRL